MDYNQNNNRQYYNPNNMNGQSTYPNGSYGQYNAQNYMGNQQGYNPNYPQGYNQGYGQNYPQQPYAQNYNQGYTQCYYTQQNPFYGQPVNGQQYAVNHQRNLRLMEHKREIKKFSVTFAVAMLGFLIASYLLSFFLMAFDLMALYENNSAFASSVGIFYSFAAVGAPFFFAYIYLKKQKLFPESGKTIYSAPKLSLKTFSIIFMSVLGCLASMYLTGIITVFFNAIGYEFTGGPEPEVNGIADLVALFVGTAIVPPLVEEFAMRNVLMQSLRKYGNLFAILASAFCFGIFHGTPGQIPFAFLCGLFIGYAVVATESIWTGVIIHLIVNGLSCSYYAATYFTDEDTGDHIYYIILAVLGVLGGISAFIYLIKYKSEFKRILSVKGVSEYSTREKFGKFICTPVMIIAIIVFVIEAILCIQPITSGFTS